MCNKKNYQEQNTMIEIRNLMHYYDKERIQKRTKFLFIVDENIYYDEMDVHGYLEKETALKMVKEMITEELIHLLLKETMLKINPPDEECRFKGHDIRNRIFDEEVLDSSSSLFKKFKTVILDNWMDDLAMDYFTYTPLKELQIHDYNDKKTVYNHYFESLNEFLEEVSFLEYVEKRVNLEIITDPVPYIEIDRLYDYYILDDSINLEGLEYVLNNISDNKIKINPPDNMSMWRAWGYYFAITHNMSDIEAESFSYLLSRLVTFSTDKVIRKNEYFKESVIESKIEDMDLQLWIQGFTIETRIKLIFNNLYEIYKNELDDYSYKNYRLNFRVSKKQFNDYMEIQGETKSEKLDALLDSYKFYREEISDDNGYSDYWVGDDNSILYTQSREEKEYIEHEKFIEKLLNAGDDKHE